MWDLIVSVPDHCLSFYFGVAFLFAFSICICLKMNNSQYTNRYIVLKLPMAYLLIVRYNIRYVTHIKMHLNL